MQNHFKLLAVVPILALAFALAAHAQTPSIGVNFVSNIYSYQSLENDSIGELLYKKYCKLCHGKSGDKGFSDAANLTQSKFTVEQREIIIQRGKGKMKAYADQLSVEEISILAEYLQIFVSNKE